MKIGMIFECGPNGADVKVYGYLAKKLDPSIVIKPVTMDNKRKLIEGCADQAKALLEIDNCEKVIILWDLQPPWIVAGRELCIVEECNLVKDLLNKAGLTARQKESVHLVCIKHELETLLLADRRAIKQFLTNIKDRPCRINLRHPEHYIDPKMPLDRLFYRHIHRGYRGWSDAEEIIKLADIDELWRCSSFERFADMVAGMRHNF